MFRTPMVGHIIHDEFHIPFMQFRRQTKIIIIGSKSRVNFVNIRLTVCVVGVTLVIVLTKWSWPNCCCAQFFNIIKIFNNSFNITSMPSSRIISVSFFGYRCITVIIRISIGKTIGHD